MEVERKVSSKELKKLLNEHINASADETISLDKLRKQMCGVQVCFARFFIASFFIRDLG